MRIIAINCDLHRPLDNCNNNCIIGPLPENPKSKSSSAQMQAQYITSFVRGTVWLLRGANNNNNAGSGGKRSSDCCGSNRRHTHTHRDVEKKTQTTNVLGQMHLR